MKLFTVAAAGSIKVMAVTLLWVAMLPSAAFGLSLRGRGVEPTFFSPPKQYINKKDGHVITMVSAMPKVGSTESGTGLRNPKYYLSYDYSNLFDRRALEGTNSLLLMFPHKKAPRTTTAEANFLNFPEAAFKRWVVPVNYLISVQLHRLFRIFLLPYLR